MFFASAAEFGGWLERHGGGEPELLVGYWKVGTGKPSMTWAQSVEQALRFGWIDGVRRSLDADSYCIRFTPRKRGSNWSAINIATAKRLAAEGRMAPAGLRAFEARTDERSAIYAYEQRKAAKLAPADLKAFKADAKAWAWYSRQAPSYRKGTAHWVTSAKKEETRARRLGALIAFSRKGQPVPRFVPPPGKGKPKKRLKGTPDSANRS